MNRHTFFGVLGVVANVEVFVHKIDTVASVGPFIALSSVVITVATMSIIKGLRL